MAGVGLVLAGAVLVGLGQWWLRVPGIEPPALPYAFDLYASQSTTPTTSASPASSSPEDGANAGIVQPTPSAAPERMSVSIPALALKARIVPANSFEQVGALRSLSIPSDASAAAWFSGGGTVANLGRGTTLVAGHVVNDGRRGAFFSLSLAKPGMLVYTCLLYTSPGVGKTLLAERLPGILPDLAVDEALEVSAIHSMLGASLEGGLIRRPPYADPHHSASLPALVGGGPHLARPGAVSRAHRGVLFLDEASEFSPAALEALRTPLEKGVIVLARSQGCLLYTSRCV